MLGIYKDFLFPIENLDSGGLLNELIIWHNLSSSSEELKINYSLIA